MSMDNIRNDAVLTTYNQLCEDFRFRTTSIWTILTIFFAAQIAILFASFGSKLSLKAYILVCILGIFFSYVNLKLVLGERKAWIVDIEELSRIEQYLYSNRQYKLMRFGEYSDIWKKIRDTPNPNVKEIFNKRLFRAYGINTLGGSFIWIIILILFMSLMWFGIGFYKILTLYFSIQNGININLVIFSFAYLALIIVYLVFVIKTI